jgi:LPS-assembly lipoprotein
MIGRRALLRTLLPLGLAGLAGCGDWVPLYADVAAGPADEQLRAVGVAPIPERIGQKLALALRESLNPAGIPTPRRYLLRITLQTVRSDLGIQSYGLGTRGKLDVYATYTLNDAATNAQLLGTTSHVAESFDILANEYAATVAEADAGTRAVEELRRDIINQLTVSMQRRIAMPLPGSPPSTGTQRP